MKWTFDWLKDYLKTGLSAEQIADILTRTGLEVEDLSEPVAPIVAKIVECKPHENSDHLHVLMVDDGSGKLRQVVCGAPNARVGLVSALAVPGCVIQGHEIQSGKLRGVVSDGMMCSGKELGVSEDHSGIIELPENTKIGSPIIDCPVVFDAGITPNRPDYLSVRGVARDLAAAGAGEFISPKGFGFSALGNARGVNLMTDKCRAYKLAEIRDIKIGPSSKKIASRLAAIGINPKNAPIDATNYICYDMGQPMHCFDADEIQGDITVRMATEGETFVDLFGNEHKLVATDMVIADDKGILALAGVIGGARGMTSDKTKNILLESAYFNPVSVRKSAKRLGISTDASYRYERGIDPTITGSALMFAVEIITEACGGEIAGFTTMGDDSSLNVEINFAPDLFLKKTGLSMPKDEM
ncbi:MAG: phenylalanine--tRNA ligase subunit beta, partial [Alphaproteobacteria bacterium]|nr:phenylalanine--tRNA ligase subunit beta [Alphaproteobacteria bacterium]